MTRISPMLAAAALLGSVTVAVPASAATLLYSFSSTSNGAPRFTFNVDSNPVLVSNTPFQFTAAVQNLTVNGTARTGVTNFQFLQGGFAGGGLSSNIVGSYGGPQLYSGTISAPTLLTGTFILLGGPVGSGGTLNITTLAAAVPESGTWMMMILGFGLAGSALRRRRVITRVSYGA